MEDGLPGLSGGPVRALVGKGSEDGRDTATTLNQPTVDDSAQEKMWTQDFVNYPCVPVSIFALFWVMRFVSGKHDILAEKKKKKVVFHHLVVMYQHG